MPTWLKVTVILIALFAALLGTAIYVGYRSMQQISGDSKKTLAEASAYGRGKDVTVCLDQALARATTQCAKGDAFCVVDAQWFLVGCVNSSTVPPGYCAAIPPRKSFSFDKRWAEEECARRGHANDSRCTQILVTLQGYCTSRR